MSCISFKLENFYFMLSKPDLGDHRHKDYKGNEISHILHLLQILGEFKRIRRLKGAILMWASLFIDLIMRQR